MSPKFQQSQTGFGMATEAGGVGMKRAAPADEGGGASIDDHNYQGMTALHHQAMNVRLGVMKMLLGLEADINAECDKGNTPLHYAAHCGEAEAVEFLIARGADLVKVNKKGQTALEMARDSIFGAAVVPLLEAERRVKMAEGDVEREKDIKSKETLYRVLEDCTSSLCIPRAWAAIKAYGVNTGGKPLDHGGPAVMEAFRRGVSDEVIEKLLESGADLEAPNGDGMTAMHAQVMDAYSVRTLLGWKADVNAQCNKGNTPLHYATAAGNVEVVNILIAHGADLGKVNEKGQTALEMARDSILGAAVVPLLEAAAL